MHKTYWKVHLNSEEVFLRDIAAVLSPIIKIKYLINKHVDELTNLFIAKDVAAVVHLKFEPRFSLRPECVANFHQLLCGDKAYF